MSGGMSPDTQTGQKLLTPFLLSQSSSEEWLVRREVKDKRPITGRRERRWRYGCQRRKRKPLGDLKRSETWRVGWEDRTAPASDGGGGHKQKKRWNQVEGAGSSTYEVIAHISLHPISPDSMIESCGKWKETERDGKSIWDAWRSLNQWLLWLHDSGRQESAVLGCTDKRFITRSVTHSKYNKGWPLKPIRALIRGAQVSQPPIGALEMDYLCRQIHYGGGHEET